MRQNHLKLPKVVKIESDEVKREEIGQKLAIMFKGNRFLATLTALETRCPKANICTFVLEEQRTFV